jgi:hypothetical protein
LLEKGDLVKKLVVRLSLLLSFVLLALSGVVVTSTGASASDTIPFTDAKADGYIGFCDSSGKQITSGKVGDAPFAVKAVSSVAAPAGYVAGTGRAVMNVYQPRKGVDPGEWSGKQLTAASLFSNTAHPMVQGIGRDPALIDFVSVFPPNWDGLVQVRMYFGAPNMPQYSGKYPATVLKVSGSTWTVETKGTVDCSAGTATSIDLIALPSSALNAPTARVSVTPGKNGVPSAQSGAGTAGSGLNGAATNATDTNGVDLSNAASEKKPSGSSSAGVVATAVVFFYRRSAGRVGHS